MKKRRLKVILLLTVMIVGVAGCGNVNKKEVSEKKVEWKEDETDSEKGLRLLSGHNNHGGICKGYGYCYNEHGLYYLNREENGYVKIRYMDFATGKEVYLCSNTGCRHNTDESGHIISNESGWNKSQKGI